MINIEALQAKVLKNIPLLEAMQIRIEGLEPHQAVISVPLLPNHNHKGTAFGGSLYSAGTAAAYVLLYALQLQAGLENRELVITRGEMKYLKPVAGNFFVRATVDPLQWQSLLESLSRRKPQRLPVSSSIYIQPERQLAEYFGEFAFLPA